MSFFYIGCLAVFFGYYIGRFELVSDWIALQEVGEYVRRFGLIFLILRWLFVVGRTSHPGFVALGGIVVAVCYQLSNTTTILCSYLVIVGSIGIGLDELVDHFRRAIGFIIAFCIATYLVILLVSPEMVSLYYRNQDFSNPRHGFLLGHPNFISALLVYYFVLCLLSRSASRSYKVMVFAVSALIIGLFTDSRTSLGLLFIVGLGYIVNNRFDFFTNRKICFIVAVLPMILMLFTYLLAT
ncbi:hypothetical protein, partial [Alistipes putredinis]|uniref:hypothetical protein n=1 Tax=Alistipes putredinis TaxID=28117 RepID=UPI003A854B77